MASTKTRKEWTPAALRVLKQKAGKSPVRSIANQLKRTVGAIRQKGHSMGLSMKVKTTAKKTTTKTKTTARRIRTTARRGGTPTARPRTATPRKAQASS